MNKPSESLRAIRKLGLVRATSEPRHQAVVERFELRVYALCDAETKASTKQLIKSYMLGLRGIRIGQEGLYEKT